MQPKNKQRIQGLWAPLITPMYKGVFDKFSMRRLVKKLEPSVDGFVPCLNSGEGDKLSDTQWKEVVTVVLKTTMKPVFAGIKRAKARDVLALAKVAERLGCAGVVIPVDRSTDKKNYQLIKNVAAAIALPIVMYNSELTPIKKSNTFRQLSTFKNVIAVKNSARWNGAMKKEIQKFRARKLLSLFDGMENNLGTCKTSDGYMTSLINVEPVLCKQAWEGNAGAQKKINELWHQYNLAHHWYITLKALLYERGVIRSTEEVSA